MTAKRLYSTPCPWRQNVARCRLAISHSDRVTLYSASRRGGRWRALEAAPLKAIRLREHGYACHAVLGRRHTPG
jgi:hypothetical protein